MPKPRKNLAGQTFYQLIVLGRIPTANGDSYYVCNCTCGQRAIVKGSFLVAGVTKSCGCRRIDALVAHRRTHGMRKTPTYKAWCGMKERCTGQGRKDYSRYGGRGIAVCERWLHSFENFFADMGERPSKGHSIDRIDVNGNYSPENCRWATASEQQNNTRRNRVIAYNGVTQTLHHWSVATGIKQGTIWKRLKDGWSVEEALTIPIHGRTN